MLGEPLSMLVPQVVGFKLTGQLPEGATATDLVLTVTEILRKAGVVGKFVEYFGARARRRCRSPTARRSGTCRPSTARRAASSRSTTRRSSYLRLTGRSEERIALVEAYCKENLLWHDPSRAADLLPDRRARPLDGRAVARRPAPPAGPRPARARQDRVPRFARDVRRRRPDEERRATTRPSQTRSRRAIRRPSRRPAADRAGPRLHSGRGRRPPADERAASEPTTRSSTAAS